MQIAFFMNHHPVIAMQKHLYLLLLLLPLTSCALFAPPLTAASIRQQQAQTDRIASVGRKLIIHNLQDCPAKRKDFGFTATRWNADASPAIKTMWRDALTIPWDTDESTVTSVLAGSPAQRAGLRKGDVITSVNDVPWSAAAEAQSAFNKMLRTASTEADTLHLVVRRNGATIPLVLNADEVCNANFHLTDSYDFNAGANDSNVYVGIKLEALLQADDELAFVLAHELAHIILGHSVLTQEALDDKKIRAKVEQEADALGVRLLMQSGYDPDVAIGAISRMYSTNGPITRFLGLQGAYLPIEDRVQFLKNRVAQVRSQSGQ